MDFYLGIDPGKNGGLAFIRAETDELVAYRTPKSEAEFVEILREYEGRVIKCAIERTTGFIGKWQPGARMFTFGWWTGGPYFACLALGFKTKLVMAHKWQRDLGFEKKEVIEKRGLDWKKHLQNAAQRHLNDTFPVQVADAVLIALWSSGTRELKNVALG